MQNIINSIWVALISGIASIIGVILTLYSIRVRPTKSSLLRRMEWEKTFLIGVSIGMMVFTFIRFYNQWPLPRELFSHSFYTN